MALDIQAVLQAQNAEFVFAQLAIEKAARLASELVHALLHELLVDGVIHVHDGNPECAGAPASKGASASTGAIAVICTQP
ncbi:hypothetical protein D560_1067 [Bordetella holmesii ATCC 51541]|nr:hypothetical protein D560_1067 [Bordetella holmesii ATCC 51541]